MWSIRTRSGYQPLSSAEPGEISAISHRSKSHRNNITAVHQPRPALHDVFNPRHTRVWLRTGPSDRPNRLLFDLLEEKRCGLKLQSAISRRPDRHQIKAAISEPSEMPKQRWRARRGAASMPLIEHAISSKRKISGFCSTSLSEGSSSLFKCLSFS